MVLGEGTNIDADVLPFTPIKIHLPSEILMEKHYETLVDTTLAL